MNLFRRLVRMTRKACPHPCEDEALMAEQEMMAETSEIREQSRHRQTDIDKLLNDNGKP